MATEIGQLERNKDRFLEYIKYFEDIARNSKHINHTDTEKHFVRYSAMDLLKARQDSLRSPFLGIETPQVKIKNDTGDNVLSVWDGALVIGMEFEKGNTADRDSKIDTCFFIFHKIIAILKKHREIKKIVDVNFAGMQATPVYEMFGNRCGVRVPLLFPSQFSTQFLTADWRNEDGTVDLPPFSTVLDQGQTIELGAGEQHQCSTAGVGTTTTVNGESTGITTPDGETTEISVTQGGNPAPGNLVDDEFQVDECPVPTGTTSTINGEDTEVTTPDGNNTAIQVLNNDLSPADGTVNGLIFTLAAAAAPTIPATITGGGDIGPFEQLTIGCDESGYDEYHWEFCSNEFENTHMHATGQNPTPYLQHDGEWTVRLVVISGTSIGYAETTVNVVDGIRPHNLQYIANTGTGGYSGTDHLKTSDCAFLWNNNDNGVLATDSEGQLNGDGGCIFRVSKTGIRTIGFSPTQDYAGWEYTDPDLVAVYRWFNDKIQLKDGTLYPNETSVDLGDMYYYRIHRNGDTGAFKLYYASEPFATSWATVFNYSHTELGALWLKFYGHGQTEHSEHKLWKYGSFV